MAVDDSDIGATPDATALLEFNITDANEPPQVSVIAFGSTLPESLDTASPVKVANILVSDDALGNEALSLSGSDAALFEIVGFELFVRAGEFLDFETNPTLNVTVRVDDSSVGSTPDDTQSLTFDVLNVNESPTNITLSANTVAENASGAGIGTVAVSDLDGIDTHTLSVSDSRFEIVTGLLKLKAGQSLNFEAANTVGLDITARDVGGLEITRPFTINVTNVNELPSSIGLSANAVAENAVGASIGTVTVTDLDGIDTHTLSVSDIQFEIVSGQLKLKAGQSLNSEAAATVGLNITARDAGAWRSPAHLPSLSPM